MARKKTFAEALTGGVSGAAGGAQVGSAISPGYGTAIGGALGGLAGAFGGYMDAQSQSGIDSANMDEQLLNNQLLRQKVRTGDTAQKGYDIFRNFLGSAFKATSPTSFGGALKPYPGLGNQVIP